MKWTLRIGGAIVVVLALITGVGMLRPATHEATVTARLNRPPADVWRVITDFARQPEWFEMIEKVERLPDRDGNAVWKENYGGFEATVVTRAAEPPVRLVREILPDGPFHGTWTWELAPEGPGTTLTVTERGTLDNPFFRGMMVFRDNSRTARDYMSALARRLDVDSERGTP